MRLLARRLVDVVGVDAAVDPAAAGGGAVRLQARIAGERLALGVVAVDLGQHRLGARLADLAVRRVVPREILDRLVARVVGVGELLADDPAEVVVEPELGAAVALGVDRLVMPLEQPLRVREGAVLFDVRRSRHEEDLGGDLLRHELAGLDLGRVVPPRCRLDLDEVADDEPVELREGEPVRLRVRVPDGRVLAGDHVALHLAVEHLLGRPVDGVVVVDPRQVSEAELVLLRRGRAPPRLQQADQVGVHLPPPTRLGRPGLDVRVDAAVVLGMRHRHVAGEDVVERRDVGRALDRRVPAEGEDAAAGPADVAEQHLDDRRRADVLDADGVLRPADRVGEGRRALAAGVLAERLGDLEEVGDGAAAGLGDDLGRVARVVALEDLEDAARVLEGRVLLGRLAVREPAAGGAVAGRLALRRVEALLALAGGAVHLHPGVLPGGDVVLALLRIPAGEEPVELLGVLRTPR